MKMEKKWQERTELKCLNGNTNKSVYWSLLIIFCAVWYFRVMIYNKRADMVRDLLPVRHFR